MSSVLRFTCFTIIVKIIRQYESFEVMNKLNKIVSTKPFYANGDIIYNLSIKECLNTLSEDKLEQILDLGYEIEWFEQDSCDDC